MPAKSKILFSVAFSLLILTSAIGATGKDYTSDYWIERGDEFSRGSPSG